MLSIIYIYNQTKIIFFNIEISDAFEDFVLNKIWLIKPSNFKSCNTLKGA